MTTNLDCQTQDLRLGELLLETGLIDAGELRAMLSLQADLRRARGARGAGVVKRFRLGRLLLDSGILDEAALKLALARLRGAGWQQRRQMTMAMMLAPA